jgi:hypothetical protein
MYGPSDLALPDQFFPFSHGCCEEDFPCNICPDFYVLDNGDCTHGSLATLMRLFGFFPSIVVLITLADGD